MKEPPPNLDDLMGPPPTDKDARLKYQMEKQEKMEWILEFDMIGVDAAIANTIRRILIAEVRLGRAERQGGVNAGP